MQLPLKILLALSGVFIVLIHLPGSCGRSLALAPHDDSINAKQFSPIDANELSSSRPVHLRRRRQEEEGGTEEGGKGDGEGGAESGSAENPLAPEVPYSFETKHLPCDMDTPSLSKYVAALPNHCLFMYNNRYTSEKFYYGFKLFQLEGFFFGQYYERMKRFEIDPHEFDYST